jgi:stage II sporulation protein AA (anti-sigma F factor antagonist)
MRRDDVGIATEELDGEIVRVILDGSLDIAGAAAIDMQMNIIAGVNKRVMVDLSKVTFLGSMGLRSLLLPARAILARGGTIVIFGANEPVRQVLKTSGIDTLIPVYPDFEQALGALRGPV